ncbi:MAG: hypothetical protein K2N71_12960 [Oscillospiraceae bacterium]|nr:hypothetical protein [Oscillospiraceae bacterium]
MGNCRENKACRRGAVRNEEQHIKQQALFIANKKQQEYEEETGHKKEEYEELVENQKSYILTQAKLVIEKISPSFAKLDAKEQKRILSRIYNELNLNNNRANEPELSF